jgi:hypothetical protein
VHTARVSSFGCALLHFTLCDTSTHLFFVISSGYPHSIRCTDDKNLLPIHLAVQHGCCNEVVDYLFRACPDAILRKCKDQQDLNFLDRKILRHEMVRKRMRILYPKMTPETRSTVMRVLEGEESKATLDTVVSRSRSKIIGVYDVAANTDNIASTAPPPPRTRECSYELDCTPLFKQIESQEWTAIDAFLASGYWPGSFFFADPLPPAVQASSWVTRFDPDLPNHARWSMLPLHMCVILDAPFRTIEKLVESKCFVLSPSDRTDRCMVDRSKITHRPLFLLLKQFTQRECTAPMTRASSRFIWQCFTAVPIKCSIFYSG